jgi:SAM-dependent methyltransferase
VLGVYLVEKMVEQSRAMAQERGVEDLVEFRTADARDLPFADDLFDVVITESVIMFFEDKLPALAEYKRVARPGGYVGMTEMAWLVTPSSMMKDSFKSMVAAYPLDATGWKEVLEQAGVSGVVGDGYRMNVTEESRGCFARYGRWRLIKVLLKTPFLLFRDRRSRRFMKDGTGALSKDVLDVVGYGECAGQKPSS